MSKIKIVFYLILAFVAYKGFVAFKDFEIGVDNRVAEIEQQAGFEKEGEVIVYCTGGLESFHSIDL